MTNLPNEPDQFKSGEILPYQSRESRSSKNIITQFRLSWKLFWDGRVSLWAKMIPVMGITYLVWPIDLIPDLLAPFIGPAIVLDDVGVLLVALYLFRRVIPEELVAEYLPSPPEHYDDVIDGEVEVLDE